MKKGIILSTIFIGGLALGLVITKFNGQSCAKNYSFINAHVVCGERQVISKGSYDNFYRQLEEYLKNKQQSNDLGEASIYFRDLENGPIFGFNELAEFAPASLLKVPIAMVFLVSAEDQSELLKYQISYTGTTTIYEQQFSPKESAKPDTLYTIEKLLQLMLVYSDNVSLNVLQTFLDENPQKLQLRAETFQELGLIDPTTKNENTLTTRGYASLFRLLYNVSFLNAEMSEKILQWLAESDYKMGLRGGVPDDIKIAHKFGERSFKEGSTKQLHDCGIIYYPGNPYLLCIMTRGDDFAELQNIIQHISKMVYEEVDSRKL